MFFGYQEMLSKKFAETVEKIKNDSKKINKLNEGMPKILLEMTESAADSVLDSLERDMYKTLGENRLIIEEFLIHQEQKWGEPLAYFEMLCSICRECGSEFSKFIKSNKELSDKPYLFISLMNLHARICTIGGEILCLMRNGYADGAYARWRSLDELKTVMYFIQAHGDKVAKSFYDYMEFEDYMEAKKESKVININGDIEFNGHYNEKQKEFALYEKKTDYEWARCAECFNPKERITYRRILEKTNFDIKFAKQYELACKTIHSSPSATFGRLSSTGKDYEPLIAGPTDCGMITPGEVSTISLVQATICFILLVPTVDSLLASQILLKLLNKIRHIFIKAEENYQDLLNKQEEDIEE